MLKSTRLTYKLLTDDNFNLFFDLFTDEHVMQYTNLPCLEDKGEAVTRFREILDNQTDSRKGKLYVATLEDENKPIGIVGYELYTLNEFGGVSEVQFLLLPDCWGKGYGTEMAEALVNEIFNTTMIHRIFVNCQSENLATVRIMKKLSMVHEGTQKDARYKDARWYDEMKYAILRKEWLKTHTITKKSDLLLFG